jgi:hypothetical protein
LSLNVRNREVELTDAEFEALRQVIRHGLNRLT